MQQISSKATKSATEPIPAIDADHDDRLAERDAYDTAMLRFINDMDLSSMYVEKISPYPILMKRGFLEDVENFQDLLFIAVSNILDRWWEDTEANFPCRMPLEPHEESVLKWVHERSKQGLMQHYNERPLHWRPDVLLPAAGHSNTNLPFKICEINARSPFNSMIKSICMFQAAATSTTALPDGVEPASSADLMMDRLVSLFKPDLPLHVVWHEGITDPIDAFSSIYKKRTGNRPCVIRATDLRLAPDSSSPTGHILCCVSSTTPAEFQGIVSEAGEPLERIYQVGLQMSHSDYSDLSSEILQQLAVDGICDLRNIFLVSDKRMLGIIRQELDSLVHTHDILTADQAEIVRQGIVHTILPGSQDIVQLLRQIREGSISKDRYLLKPARGHRGMGIYLGKSTGQEEFKGLLEEQVNSSLPPDRRYVIQPFIEQELFDLRLSDDSEPQQCRMTGTYHAIGGCFAGLGAWRADSEEICSRFHGAFSIPAVVPR
ncbi:uncharacterized protein TRUGW13939_01403 [Talaromyces rugulosus]|uniref:Glutathionylspermidine synthase pre-ATP-grasp-like domain-containing protein n=1 Tax=Talaromyces rugulosus TaxID=121627 RepID=A0A7H8QK57_TALRU|nr:uncharacterized protein TRUGW13939_01403 [Talaromyces rugulosus]QKX54317.1 hypothetical protein TRUGW13939_01403 [Talaromyces rugulosus]